MPAATHTWPLREITLKVLDLPAQIEFYEAFGFALLEKNTVSAVLAAGDGLQLTLKLLRTGRARPRRTAGLFHLAIAVPDRAELSAFLRHAARQRWNFFGAADHLVSEALYFSDPEDNGIEVYFDRPRESWRRTGTRIEMDTLPLDLSELARMPGPEFAKFSGGTRLGHIHLTVGDLDASQAFYESLGLQQTASLGAFRFFSWDDYHHHVAINIAHGRNAEAVSGDISGIESFSVARDTMREPRTDPSNIVVGPPA